jgi:hypothetical protein
LTWKSHIKFGIKYRGTAGTASRVEAEIKIISKPRDVLFSMINYARF